MENKKKCQAFFFYGIIGCMMFLSSCTEKDFELSNIDMTVGLGGERDFTVYGDNSTEEIQMDQLLDIQGSEFIEIDKNGDYVLIATDGDVKSSFSVIKPLVLASNNSASEDIQIDVAGALPASASKRANMISNIPFSGVLTHFEWATNDVPAELRDLIGVEGECNLQFQLDFPEQIAAIISTIDELTFVFPKQLVIDKIIYNGEKQAISSDNTFTVHNVLTKKGKLSLTASLSGIDATVKDYGNNKTRFVPEKEIAVEGEIILEGLVKPDGINFSEITKYTSASLKTLTNFDDIKINKATGKFKYIFNFDDLGAVSLNGIPDFLNDEEVVADLYNPVITLNFKNNLPVRGIISGKMVSKDAQNNEMATVNIPSFYVPSNESSVMISRQPIDGNNIVIPNLTDLIRKIPKKIEFVDVVAMSDETYEGTIEFGKEYSILSNYDFRAPLAFGKDAVIVYSDTIKDINDNIKDLSFKEENGVIDGYLKAEADIINRIPVNLNVEGFAIDLNGNKMSSSEISIVCEQVIAASDGNNPITTHVTVVAKPASNEMLRLLDKIVFKIKGASDDKMYGIPLNAYRHTLTVKNLTVTKHGQIVGDFN